ncbi:MAG TPA: YgiT-type zinc finger protein, partial [Candidatus Bathyarchaeota archaeon]|nr:YgiT-type zinc finger protein [Candidatus Bathyarchaeota archaeon]
MGSPTHLELNYYTLALASIIVRGVPAFECEQCGEAY